MVDEVDGIYEPNEGDSTVKTLVSWVKQLTPRLPPVIFICNDRWSPHMRCLSQECEDIRFYPLRDADLTSILRKAVTMEKYPQLGKAQEERMVKEAAGDARRLLNLLHFSQLHSQTEVFSLPHIQACSDSS